MKIFFYLCGLLFALFFVSTRSTAQAISSHSEYFDPTCGGVSFHLLTIGCTASETVVAYYGDGTSGIHVDTCGGSIGFVNFSHAYAASGTYTVKHVLYTGTSPVDSVTFSLAVNFCRQLPVVGYHDANSNCVHDAGEDNIIASSLIKVDSAGTPIDTVSMTGGMWYVAYGAPGTVYGFTVLSPPAGMVATCPSTGTLYSTIPAIGTPATAQEFGFECTGSTSVDLVLSATFRTAVAGLLANRAAITVYNTYCAPPATSPTVKFEYSPKFTFGSIYPSTLAYTVSGTSVTVAVGTLTPLTTKYFYVYLTPTVTLTFGDTVNSKFTVNPLSGDTNPSNNVVVRCDTVRASYDPNAKSVTPTGDIAAGTRLEYMLEFENDGNDTAHNIHIMDTLSNDLDVKTLQMGASTHKVNLVKYVNAGNNILKFDFPNIMLPDSSHHDYCRGAVIFSIKAKSTLSPGTTIANRVGIYFDTNPVVMTNTAYSKIPLPTGVKTMGRLTQVELYPNPVSDDLTIKAESGAYKTLTIYNVVGQAVAAQDIGNAEAKVNVRSLVPGIYYVTLKGVAGTKTIKFEKQ